MNLDRNEFLLVADATNGLTISPGMGYKPQILDDVEDSIFQSAGDTKRSERSHVNS